MTGCQDSQCMRAMKMNRPSRQFTATMRNTITSLVTIIYKLTGYQRPTPDEFTRRPIARPKRGAIDFTGDASSWLFSTSTVAHFNEVRELLTQVKIGSDMAWHSMTPIQFGLQCRHLKVRKQTNGWLTRSILDMEVPAISNIRGIIDEIQRSVDFETA